MLQSGPKDIRDLFMKKIDTVDFAAAKQEVSPFLKDLDSVAIWSKAFFREIIFKMKFI